ncbi:MAG: hypothetical protein GY820_16010 [Gammaproteobacteria bacterium]|nr:hypothetical protein [Gammaproteobacteria bacterium]
MLKLCVAAMPLYMLICYTLQPRARAGAAHTHTATGYSCAWSAGAARAHTAGYSKYNLKFPYNTTTTLTYNRKEGRY